MNKYKSLITKPEELKIGNTYFAVHKFYDESWVTDTQVNSKPKKSENIGSLYIDTETYNGNIKSYIPNHLYLSDFNIPKNTYNRHHIFSNEQEAIDYANS